MVISAVCVTSRFYRSTEIAVHGTRIGGPHKIVWQNKLLAMSTFFFVDHTKSQIKRIPDGFLGTFCHFHECVGIFGGLCVLETSTDMQTLCMDIVPLDANRPVFFSLASTSADCVECEETLGAFNSYTRSNYTWLGMTTGNI